MGDSHLTGGPLSQEALSVHRWRPPNEPEASVMILECVTNILKQGLPQQGFIQRNSAMACSTLQQRPIL